MRDMRLLEVLVTYLTIPVERSERRFGVLILEPTKLLDRKVHTGTDAGLTSSIETSRDEFGILDEYDFPKSTTTIDPDVQ